MPTYTKRMMAVRHAANRKDNTSGIAFETDGGVVATNGLMLLHVPPAEGFENMAVVAVTDRALFARASVSKLAKSLPKAKDGQVAILIENDEAGMKFDTPAGPIRLEKEDLTRPPANWRSKIPDSPPKATVALDPRLLMRLMRAAVEWGGGQHVSVKFEVWDEMTAVVLKATADGDDATMTAIVMPVVGRK